MTSQEVSLRLNFTIPDLTSNYTEGIMTSRGVSYVHDLATLLIEGLYTRNRCAQVCSVLIGDVYLASNDSN
jgi:hypothetical protein